MRGSVLIVLALAAGCSGEKREASKAAEDAAAVAMVERAQKVRPPLQPIRLQPIDRGALGGNWKVEGSCTFMPAGTDQALFIGNGERGVVQIDGEIVVLAADSGSTALPSGARERYTGKAFTAQLGMGGESSAAPGKAAAATGSLALRDQWERLAFDQAGRLACTG